MGRKILISGAGIAGPVLAYWLARHGFEPMVVERAAELRTGGHPVDLWGSAVDVMDQMGVLSAIDAARTGNDRGVTIVPGRPPFEINLRRLSAEFSDRHVEIMRGELVSILYERTREDIEYRFGDSIAALSTRNDAVRVTLKGGEVRDFAVVIGADGQHSNVRRLAFGEEARFSHYVGGYVAGYAVPDRIGLNGRIHRDVVPGKTVVAFPIRQDGEAGVGFLFRRPEPLDLHHDDVEGQKRVLLEIFAEEGWEVPRFLNQLENGRGLSISTQSARFNMEQRSRDRITLVGDAGDRPAPAVGGGTTLAVVAAYRLAAELAATDDCAQAMRNCDLAMAPLIRQSRNIAPALL